MLRRAGLTALLFVVGCGDAGADSEGSEEEGAGSETEGALEEELFGLVTVTHYPADAAGVPEYVDLAAGLRSEPFEGIEDFVSVVHLQTTFAPPQSLALYREAEELMREALELLDALNAGG